MQPYCLAQHVAIFYVFHSNKSAMRRKQEELTERREATLHKRKNSGICCRRNPGLLVYVRKLIQYNVASCLCALYTRLISGKVGRYNVLCGGTSIAGLFLYMQAVA